MIFAEDNDLTFFLFYVLSALQFESSERVTWIIFYIFYIMLRSATNYRTSARGIFSSKRINFSLLYRKCNYALFRRPNSFTFFAIWRSRGEWEKIQFWMSQSRIIETSKNLHVHQKIKNNCRKCASNYEKLPQKFQTLFE